MTKMAAMPIYGKNPLKNFFPGISGKISMKRGMQHQGLRPIIVCSNYYPGLTFTYFLARSNFATGFCIEKIDSGEFEIIAACDLEIGWYA